MSDKYGLNVFTYGYLNWKHPFHNIKMFFRNIRRAWQRATKGYCDWDVFDLDQYWQGMMICSLEDLRKEGGYPGCLESEEEWEQILTDMINYLNEGLLDSHENEFDYLMYGDLEGDERLRDYTEDEANHKWFEEEKRLRAVEDENLQKGLALVAKWWRHLWW